MGVQFLRISQTATETKTHMSRVLSTKNPKLIRCFIRLILNHLLEETRMRRIHGGISLWFPESQWAEVVLWLPVLRLLCCSLVVTVLVLEITLCNFSLCSVQDVEHEGHGCTHTHLYSGFLSGLWSRWFFLLTSKRFSNVKKWLSHLFSTYIISCYRRSIFLAGSHKVKEKRSDRYIPLRLLPAFPQQSRILRLL